jgi:hypothetical protein
MSLHQLFGHIVTQYVDSHVTPDKAIALPIGLIVQMMLLDRNELHVVSFVPFEL